MASRSGRSPGYSPRRAAGPRGNTRTSTPTSEWSSRTVTSSSCPCRPLLHQRILRFLFQILDAFVTVEGSARSSSPGREVRLWEGKFREPDIVFIRAEHGSRITEDYFDGADLVMEVVSDSASDRHRDLVEKRAEYARAGIPEYWIVDPEEGRITVLTLEGTEYA